LHSSIFFGGSVIAAVIAGSVSLFAPCCISVMLPAYFSTAFQNRRMLVAMTFLFAAGVATVILPIAMGAAAVQRFITAQHEIVYVTAGVALLALSIFTLAGGRLHLPMPGRRGGTTTGPWSVYSLGVFSGVTTSCCAPVLAGVLALSGVASSFGLALGLGLAYVFGMVAPLFFISLLWERLGDRAAGLLRPRSLRLRVGPWRRELSAAALASGLLLALIGVGTLFVGLESNAMPNPSGWEASLSAHLAHYGSVTTHALSFIPGVLAGVLLAIAVALLARRALRQVSHPAPIPERQTGNPAPASDSDTAGDLQHKDAPFKAQEITL
jgi:cytochrome c-type biogenesis protein